MLSTHFKLKFLLKKLILILAFFFLADAASLHEIDESYQLPVNILDIDGDQNYDALTDGILILRSLFGLEGSELISGVVSENGVYQTADSIQARLTTFKPLFDVDKDGQIDALTDGLLILRFLFGLSDESLVNNTISQGAERFSPLEISQYLAELSPQLNKPDWEGISFYAEEPQGTQWIDATYRRLTESEQADSAYSSLITNYTRTNLGLFFHQNNGLVNAIVDDFEGSEGSDNWGIDIGDQIAIADINGDGFEDIIMSHRFAPNKSTWKAKAPILILVNQRNGLLEVDPCIFENCAIPYSNEAYLPHVDDFNGDNILDFITIGADPVVLISSENGIKDSSQNFKSMLIDQRVGGSTESIGDVWTHTTAVGDLDNNGTVDMYIPDYILDRNEPCGGHPAGCHNYTLLNDGNGSFVVGSADFPFTGNVWGSAIADFDNDGYGDILISLDDIQENHIFYTHKHWDTSSGMIMFGNSEGNYKSNITYLDTSLLGEHFVGLEFFIDDLDSDGDQDIIAIQTGDRADYYKGNEIQIFRNNGDRTFDDISSDFVDRSLEPYLETHINLDFKLPAAYFQYTDIDNDGDKDLWPKTGQYNQPYYLRTDSGFKLAGLAGTILDYGEEANNCENQCASTFYAGLAIDIDKNGLTDFFQMEVIDSVENKSGYVASQLMTIKDPFNEEAD